MGKKVHNAKARAFQRTIVDNSETRKIKLDDSLVTGSSYDEANALALPSKKRKTKTKIEVQHHTKILSKKQKKRLEKIVEKKKKKEGRASVLEALQKVQIPEDELKTYQSITQVQTIGLKRIGKLDVLLEKQKRKKELKAAVEGRISSLAGVSKRKRMQLLQRYNDGDDSDSDDDDTVAKRKNPNIVGMEVEISSSDDDNEEEVEEPPTAEPIKESVVTPEQKAKQVIEKPVAPSKPAVYVHLKRDPEIQAARLRLPILAEEQVIMETINENSIIIIAGETGSGKTTQIPQFLYESGYAEKKLIGVTEPRRVAAISMSKRVAREMNLSEKEVSYLIRFEGNVTDQTRIKFMTDGVLLKEIESDFLLSKYSVIILDEAHERSAYTDILIGLLSRIVPLRIKRENPLKMIIMSATLRVEDFLDNSRLFKIPPPLLKVEARQFPVTVHFQKTTAENYVDEAYRKAIKIHSKLPEGGILIFVTGQQEVNHLVRKLRRTFPYTPTEGKPSTNHQKSDTNEAEAAKEEDEDEDEFDMKKAIKNVKKSKKKFANQIALPKINLDDYKLPGDDTQADLLEDEEDLDKSENEDQDEQDDDFEITTSQPLWVLPLYSLLSSEKQSRIFQPPPEGCRLCIVSTNVAETSLTIPNIKYVVDSGRQKTRLYDKITGVSAFIVTFTSKASADQRAGRAGRTSAGHCYRLYSSAVYNDEFEAFSTPDIQKKPVDDLMMQMRCMGIDRVINFPFPSPPDAEQLQAAENRLIILGALGPKENPDDPKCVPPVTRLGQVITRFPVAPRFGKMLALSHQQNMLPYTVCLVAALSVQELLVEASPDKEINTNIASDKWQRRRRSWASTGNFELLGDPMVLLRAVGAAEYAGYKGKLESFCSENGLRHKALTEVRKLRVQLTNEINLNLSNVDLCVDPEMPPPTDKQAKFLRQILLAGMGDRVARKVPLDEISDKEQKRKMKYAYHCLDMEEPVFIHSSSLLRKKLPEWVIYQEAYETRNGDSTKLFIRGITAIEPEWLLIYIPRLCNILSIKEDPQPKYNAEEGKVYCFVDATYGRAGWQIPLAEVEMPLSEKACCYFGMFLLNGDVFPKLADFKPKLKTTPSSIVKSWSNLNENLTKFKQALIGKEINNKQKLVEMWETEPNFLLPQYCNLLFGVNLAEISSFWPPIETDP